MEVIMYITLGEQETIIGQYTQHLIEEEKTPNTIKKYRRDVRKFLSYCKEQVVNKQLVLSYKEHLLTQYKTTSVNSMLVAMNHFLHWYGHIELQVRTVKIQRELFENPQKELTKEEYERLVHCAEKKGDIRLALIVQSICATGIRVSELPYITVEALATRRSEVRCKGKKRIIFLPKELCRKLVQYCKGHQIKSGAVFVTKKGKVLDRSNIWKMMKALCEVAQVASSKVFPHNLRHLFARTYYEVNKDLGKLADLLGHTSIETTRIYTMESGENHDKQLEKMGLIVENTATT